MRITFLGTGTSNGIPVIGCDCRVCTSPDLRNRRTRSSALVHADEQTILIDTTPELRLQAVANGVSRVDAVLYTHAHADHVAGFDDLRSFNYLNQSQVDVYVDPVTHAIIHERFAYAFENPFPFFGGKPDLRMHVFEGPFQIGPTPVTPFPVGHGRWTVWGFRFRDLVYLTDAKEIPAESLAVMRDARVLVINGLREKPHPVHLSIPEAIEIIRDLKPERAYLTHLSHDVCHSEMSETLPDGIELAYDGLVVEV